MIRRSPKENSLGQKLVRIIRASIIPRIFVASFLFSGMYDQAVLYLSEVLLHQSLTLEKSRGLELFSFFPYGVLFTRSALTTLRFTLTVALFSSVLPPMDALSVRVILSAFPVAGITRVPLSPSWWTDLTPSTTVRVTISGLSQFQLTVMLSPSWTCRLSILKEILLMLLSFPGFLQISVLHFYTDILSENRHLSTERGWASRTQMLEMERYIEVRADEILAFDRGECPWSQ